MALPTTPVEIKQSRSRDDHGRFVDSEKPLVNFTVTHPITPFKRFFDKVLGNEGVDIRFKIHPLTAIAIGGLIGLGSFGLGRFTFPKEHFLASYLPQLLVAQSSPDPWRETAFAGILRVSQTSSKFYLQTEKAEAITLEVPKGINLKSLTGKRIFATGRFNTQTGVLVVAEATDLELLPVEIRYLPGVSPQPRPSVSPSPTPSPLPSALPMLEASPAATPAVSPVDSGQ